MNYTSYYLLAMAFTDVNAIFYRELPKDIRFELYRIVKEDAKRLHRVKFSLVTTEIEMRNLGFLDDDDIEFIRKSIWLDPSNRLLSLTKDVGCVDYNYFRDFFYSEITSYNILAGEVQIRENECINNNTIVCSNCQTFNFPCENLVEHFWISRKSCKWIEHFRIKS